MVVVALITTKVVQLLRSDFLGSVCRPIGKEEGGDMTVSVCLSNLFEDVDLQTVKKKTSEATRRRLYELSSVDKP